VQSANINVNYIIICAVDSGYGMGKENNIPWLKDRRFKWDMDHFISKTAHSTVIMGYNTMKSIRKPLKTRVNIVIAKNDKPIDSEEMYVDLRIIKDEDKPIKINFNDNQFYIVSDLQTATNLAEESLCDDEQDIYIIGGRKTYIEAIEKNIVSSAYISVLEDFFDCDVLFPVRLFNNNFLKISSCKYDNGEIFEYICKKKK